MSERNNRTKRTSRQSFVWPLILVALGVVFLLSNLGILRDDIWNNIWRLWPVIFIAIGLDSLFRRYEIAGPVFMIVLGSAFLLNSSGVMGWGAWDVLWRLWPVLLVAVGIEIIIGRRSLWVSLLAVTVIVCVLGGAIWYIGVPSLVRADVLEETSVHQVLSDIDDARISLRPAVGRLTVVRSQDPKTLVSGSFEARNGGNVYVDYAVDSRTGIFEMKTQPMMNFPGEEGWEWDLGLTDQIPLDLDLSMGVGQIEADLTRMILTSLDVNQAIGEISVSLAPGEDYRGEFSQAIGKIRLVIPEASGVRIDVSRAISSFSIPSDFDQRGDFYYSPNYEQADYKIQLEVSQAIGSIEVYIEP